MEINSAFSFGVSGFNQAAQKITRSSERIAEGTIKGTGMTSATANQSSAPISGEIINMKIALGQAKASSQVILTVDDMLGSLINITV